MPFRCLELGSGFVAARFCLLISSLGWLMGKSTGNPSSWWLKQGFPVDFPSDQCLCVYVVNYSTLAHDPAANDISYPMKVMKGTPTM